MLWIALAIVLALPCGATVLWALLRFRPLPNRSASPEVQAMLSTLLAQMSQSQRETLEQMSQSQKTSLQSLVAAAKSSASTTSSQTHDIAQLVTTAMTLLAAKDPIAASQLASWTKPAEAEGGGTFEPYTAADDDLWAAEEEKRLREFAEHIGAKVEDDGGADQDWQGPPGRPF
jgi:hypothetical protein